jgi:iron complex outermembrane receptor protein
MSYKDQLVLTGKLNDVGDAVRINIPKSYRLGVEAWGGLQINKWLEVQANITLSKNKLRQYVDYIPMYDGDFEFTGYDTLRFDRADISFSPWLTAFGAINVKPVKNMQLSINNKGVSKQYLDNTNSEYKKLNGYFVQDVQLRYTINKKVAKAIDFVLQVNNVLNRKYETNGYTYSYFYQTSRVKENFYYPMAGTNFLLAVNLHF